MTTLPRLGDEIRVDVYTGPAYPSDPLGEIIEMEPDGMLVRMPWHVGDEAAYVTYGRDANGCHKYVMTIYPEDRVNALH